jgi:UDP-N-acetyl-D-glucosamine dehydrogenase
MADERTVAVLGLGYVGLPLVCAAVEAGHRLIGFDVSEERVRELRSGRSRIDDVGSDQLRRALDTGRLRFTRDPRDLREAHTYVICVPTPLLDKQPDLSMVVAAVETVARNVSHGDLVVLESTTYPGTTEELVAPKIAAISGLAAPHDYHLAFSPERIDPGNPVFGLRNTPRYTPGSGSRSGVAAGGLTGAVSGSSRNTLPVSRTRSGCRW